VSEKLTNAVDRLTDQVTILRQVLDEVRESLQWWVRNQPADLAAEVSEVREQIETLTGMVQELRPATQGKLFE
jgi:prefoldin subunit 5